MRVGTTILAHLRTNYVWQQSGSYSYNAVYYEQTDTSGMSFRMTKRQMPFGYGDYSEERQAEFDSGGTNVGLVSNYQPQYGSTPTNVQPLEQESVFYTGGQQSTCNLDGMAINCSQAQNMMDHGAAIPAELSGLQNLGFTFDVIGGGFFRGSIPTGLFYGENRRPIMLTYTAHFNFGFSFGIPRQSNGTGGGGSDELNTGDKAKFSKETLKECLKKQGVTGNYAWSRETGGTFQGTYFDSSDVETGGAKSININTTIDRNSSTLAQDLNRANGNNRWKTQSGITLGNSPGLNWIASDVAGGIGKYKDVGVLALYIHELGNAIALQIGLPNPFKGYEAENRKAGVKDDEDFGQTLETCVFKGRVGLRSGRIGPNREL